MFSFASRGGAQAGRRLSLHAGSLRAGHRGIAAGSRTSTLTILPPKALPAIALSTAAPSAPASLGATRAFSLWPFGRSSAAPEANSGPSEHSGPSENSGLTENSDPSSGDSRASENYAAGAIAEEKVLTEEAGVAGAGELRGPSSSSSVEGMLADPALAAASEASMSPVSLLLTGLDTVHLATGAPWWLTIVGSALVMRAALSPLAVITARSTARLALIKPDLERIGAELKGATTTKRKQVLQLEMASVMQRNGAHPLKPLMMSLAQAPFLITFFMALRRIGNEFPDVSEQGLLWFQDLSVPDSLYILPVLSSLTFLLMIEANASVQNSGPRARIMKNVFRGVAVIMIPVTAMFPAALFMYWIPSNLFTISQNLFMKSSVGRKMCNIPHVPEHIVQAETGKAAEAAAAKEAAEIKELFSSKRESRGMGKGTGKGSTKGKGKAQAKSSKKKDSK